MKLRCTLFSILTLPLIGMVFLRAGTDKQMVAPEEIAVSKSETKMPSDWSIEVGTGVQWSNVRASGDDGYTMIPGKLTAALAVDQVSLDDFAGGYFRGYTEFLFQGYGYALTNSPVGESRILGLNVGPRYNFVQPGWKLVPYVQGLVGLGFTDSDATPNGPNAHGLGQDFNFSFGVGAGVRYDINDSWFVRVGAEYTHFSNAGLSEPEHSNRPIDAVGPIFAVGIRL